ncbi:hypothetical protein [Mycolicibacterium peregrinum]|uniref:hypothetical protein n=1 Tax=Mycolicibacterium peregrinum TaxID=43304 RepID=UPI000A8B5E4D
MTQAQNLLMSLLNLGLMAAGVFCILKGGFAVHSGNDGNDDINIRGWKKISSWWALGAVMLIPGAWGQFGGLIQNVWQQLF